jgi:hypothetical protein
MLGLQAGPEGSEDEVEPSLWRLELSIIWARVQIRCREMCGVLCGLGVPSLRGAFQFYFYTTITFWITNLGEPDPLEGGSGYWEVVHRHLLIEMMCSPEGSEPVLRRNFACTVACLMQAFRAGYNVPSR